MAKVIECTDGYVIRGDTDDELIENALAHMGEHHPALTLGRDELLAMAVER